MLVIDQDSVEDVLIPEPQKKPAKAPRGRPLSENALKVQQLVENCFTNPTYVHTVDFRYVQSCPQLSPREYKSSFRPEVRCSICCSVLEEENRDSVLNIFKSFEDNKLHSVIKMLENIIGS